MLNSFSDQLDELLGTSIAAMDIPDHLHELAVQRYKAFGAWTGRPGHPDFDSDVFTQGSFRLGTVTQPVGPRTDYDIDLVYRRNISKGSTSQVALKTEAGNEVGSFASSRPEGLPTVKEGKRCWTLLYTTDPFHMDVLPAIPDENGGPNSILLTDKELRNWQKSNPVDFAQWFHHTMRTEFLESRVRLARLLKAADIEKVPEWKVKTTLQRSVQALKRHRDLFFMDQPQLRPASIIITTLAAQAYLGGGGVFEVLLDVSGKMPALVGKERGIWIVTNPVQEEENFADRWNASPEKAEAFFQWIERAHIDFKAYAQQRGVHSVLDKIATTLGHEPAKRAGAAMGTLLSGARAAGDLRMSDGSGALQRVTGRKVPEHTFHGDPISPPA